jgi:hypothetical protein
VACGLPVGLSVAITSFGQNWRTKRSFSCLCRVYRKRRPDHQRPWHKPRCQEDFPQHNLIDAWAHSTTRSTWFTRRARDCRKITLGTGPYGLSPRSRFAGVHAEDSISSFQKTISHLSGLIPRTGFLPFEIIERRLAPGFCVYNSASHVKTRGSTTNNRPVETAAEGLYRRNLRGFY